MTFIEGLKGTIPGGTTTQMIKPGEDCTPVTAVPDTYYHFTGWTGDVTSNENPLTVSKVTHDMTITANFTHNQGTIILNQVGNGSVDGGGIFDTNTLQNITATDSGNSHFVNWTLSGQGIIAEPNSPNTTLILTGLNDCSATATANFFDLTTNNTLAKAVPLANLNGLAGESHVYRINVPDSLQKYLMVTLKGFTGDCDLYARYDKIPSTFTYDYKSTNPAGQGESITILNPLAGDWYIMIHAYAGYTGATLEFNFGADGLATPTGFAVSNQIDRVRLRWNDVPDATAYEIWRSKTDSILLAEKKSEVADMPGSRITYEDVFEPGNYHYYYWVKAKNGSMESDFAGPLPGNNLGTTSIALNNGTAVLASGDEDSIVTYSIYIPDALQSLLDIKVSGGTGDCDIDVVDPAGKTVKRILGGGSDGLAQFANPERGTWLIHLYGSSNYTGVSVLAKYSKQTAMPAVPAGVNASDGLFADRIVVRWTAVAGATSYVVARNALNSKTGVTELGEVTDIVFEDKSAAVTGDTPGKLFYYFVKAKNTFDYGNYGTGNSGYISKKPVIPAVPVVSNGTYFDHINIKWTKVKGATMYEVWRSNTTNSADAKLLVKTSQLFYDNMSDYTNGGTVATLNRGNTYYYFIKAGNGNGWSDFSRSDYGKVSVKGPATVTATKGVYWDNIAISWSAVPGATSYDIYCDDSFTGNTEGRIFPYAPIDNFHHKYQVKAKYLNLYESDFSPSATGQALATGKTCFFPSISLNSGKASDLQDDGAGNSKYFSVDVPVGMTRLVATIDGSPILKNDCDLFAKFATCPTKASYGVKGVESGIVETITVSNPAAGTWYFLLYGTTAYSGVTLKVTCYSVADIVLTQVPANDLAVPFTAKFAGKVLDESGINGIPNIVLKARNPITGAVSVLTKTDAKGVFKYSTAVNSEGEHTFDFFFNDMPDTAKGTASHTVATRKGCLEANGFFDMSAYIPAEPVVVPLHADVMGLQDFLDTRNAWDEDPINGTYETIWVESTLVKAKDDTQLADKLDEGLYMFFYGVEGAGVGNDTTTTSALSAVPFVLHVEETRKGGVLAKLKLLELVDESQETDIMAGRIGIVAVVSLSSPNDAAVPANISLTAGEQLELLSKLAGNSDDVSPLGNMKYSDVPSKLLTVILSNGRKLNVVGAGFVK